MNKLTLSQKIFIILFFTIFVPPLLLIGFINIFEQNEISSIESNAEKLQKKVSYKLDNFNITSVEENELSDFLVEIVKSDKKISKISVLSQYENEPYCICLATSQKDYFCGKEKYDGEEIIEALDENKISTKEYHYFDNTEDLSTLNIAIPYNNNSGEKIVILYRGNYYSKVAVLDLLKKYLQHSIYFALILFFIIFFIVIHPFSKLNKYLMTDVYKQRKIIKKNLVAKEMPYFRNDFFGEMARNIDEYSSFLNTMASGLCLNTELKIVDVKKGLESIKKDINVLQETGNKEVLSDIISQVNIITKKLSIPFNLMSLKEKIYNTTVVEVEKFNISYEAYKEFKVNTDYSIKYNNNQIIEIIKTIISTYEKATIGFNYDSSNYSIIIQENHLEQIFRILLDNAIEAGNEVYVTLKKIDSVLQIKVEDNGEGLENSLYIFEPFYTSWSNSRENHIGLGLTLLREIVSGYKGEIMTNYDKLINSKYSGACFEITLPLL